MSAVEPQIDLDDEQEAEGEDENYLTAFNAWIGIATSPPEEGFLEQTTIEGLLLQIERKRLTGYLDLSRRTRDTRLGFRHGFLVSFYDSVDLEPTEVRHGELLARVLGWRSGSFAFTATERVKTEPGFPLRPGKLLTIAWLFFVGERKRMLAKRSLFAKFVDFSATRSEVQFLREISRIRVLGLTGTLRVSRRQGERSLTFVNGELRDVLSNTQGNQITDLIVRYHLISPAELTRLSDQHRTTGQSIIDLALSEGVIHVNDLTLLHMLQKWERCFEICHWDELITTWEKASYSVTTDPKAMPKSHESTIATQDTNRHINPRCQFCGQVIDETKGCLSCSTRSRRMKKIRQYYAEGHSSAKKGSPLGRILLKKFLSTPK